MTLAGILWYFFVTERSGDGLLVTAVVITYTIHLAIFAFAIKGKFDIKLAYLSAILYDLLFLPIYITVTGNIDSSFYLLFFLTVSVGAYVLTFWFATTLTTIVTAVYLAILLPYFSLDILFDISMRVGFLWVCFLTIAYASDFLRKSEGRLMKLFDTLNMRTSELERSQAQLEMIYENTRILASLLEPDGVVNEIMRILGSTRQFESFGIIFLDNRGNYYFRARNTGIQRSAHLKAIEPSRTGLIRRVVAMAESVVVKNVRGRDDYVPLNEQTESAIITPMTSHGKTHGLLVAETSTPGAYSSKEEQMLTIVARSAGLALENAYLHRKTEEMSIIDDLTSIYNYRYFVRKLEEEKRRAIRYDLPLSLIMVDIDWFKKLNDSYGHEVGNQVLSELAVVIKKCIRDVDVFARYGGEEFVIILPQTPQGEASVLAERIRKHIEDHVVNSAASGKLRVTVSVGVTSYPENGKSAEDLVSTADQALYRAKGSGKNLVCTV
jgi:diguanylate cyclase (GGDEF)-like protein